MCDGLNIKNEPDVLRILVIGNGFDLAHGLPTRYVDFLDFCRTAQNIANGDSNEKQIQFFGSMYNLFNQSKYLGFAGIPTHDCIDKCKEIELLLRNNIWFDYLYEMYEIKKMSGENWIDFESEFSYIIYHLDNISQDLNDNVIQKTEIDFDKYLAEPELKTRKEEFFWTIFSCITDNYQNYTFKDLRKTLLNDLKRLTNSLDIYCSFFIEKMINKSMNNINKIIFFVNINPSIVVSFNYTHTYENIYKDKKKTSIYYPHGKCYSELFPKRCNLVLGIDEYWKDDRRDTDTNYTVFKKYVQRIQKGTYIDINDLFEEIDKYRLTIDTSTPNEPKAYEDLSKKVDLFFFGHSLDITDKDILYKLFNIKQVKCTILCKDEETQGDYIANVVKIIGQDELLKRMEHNKISFERLDQQEEF